MKERYGERYTGNLQRDPPTLCSDSPPIHLITVWPVHGTRLSNKLRMNNHSLISSILALPIKGPDT